MRITLLQLTFHPGLHEKISPHHYYIRCTIIIFAIYAVVVAIDLKIIHMLDMGVVRLERCVFEGIVL